MTGIRLFFSCWKCNNKKLKIEYKILNIKVNCHLMNCLVLIRPGIMPKVQCKRISMFKNLSIKWMKNDLKNKTSKKNDKFQWMFWISSLWVHIFEIIYNLTFLVREHIELFIYYNNRASNGKLCSLQQETKTGLLFIKMVTRSRRYLYIMQK